MLPNAGGGEAGREYSRLASDNQLWYPGRDWPLNASARQAIALYVGPRLSIEKPSLKTVAAKWPRPTSAEAFAPLWVSQKGGTLSTSAMGQMIAEVVKDAGDLVPPDTSAHTLRHTFARNYLAQYPDDLVGLATCSVTAP